MRRCRLARHHWLTCDALTACCLLLNGWGGEEGKQGGEGRGGEGIGGGKGSKAREGRALEKGGGVFQCKSTEV